MALGTVVLVGTAIGQAAGQAWPPFVLVAGLLLISAVVEADGLFAALGARIERVSAGTIALLATLLGLEAIVTAVLDLDTAVVFLTPVILHAPRRRNCDERPSGKSSRRRSNRTDEVAQRQPHLQDPRGRHTSRVLA